MVHAERIAIVGMACRYPDAATPDELWQTVLAKRRAFRRIPESRLARGYRDPAGSPDSTYATRAAVLRDWTFDREHFGVPGPLYRAADHTHWLALETAAAALTDAGFAGGEGIDRDTAGVVLGNSLAGEFSRAGMLRLRWPFFADAAAAALQNAGAPAPLARDVLERLETLVKQPFEEPGDETLSGALANTIAGRICNHFDFHGTGYTVDGACSSSLLAVTTACRALAAGECDFLLAGGVDLSLDPLELVGFARLGALAEDDMRIYDARPTGFLPGEGCGVVALMRADDAEARGLRTYAHIVGWAMSSDGAGGLTRPELRGQTLALHRAYQAATLEPGQVRMVEGHGTGTAIGDSVELRALASVRDHDTAPAALGSIKANIGHTKAAAGAAGLIKAALAVHHRVLPPITGCDRPHEMLRGGTGPLRVLDEPEPWPDEVARAGVSSMGFGGINVHVILEGTGQASPVVLPEPARKWSVRTGPQEIVLLGADSAGALAERLSHLAGTAAMLSDAEVRDVAATAWHQRSECHSFRAALVATTPDDLASAARAASAAAGGWDGDVRFDERAGYALGSGDPVRVGLLFPGQAAPVRPELPWWARRLDVPTLPAGMASPAEPIDTAVAQPVIVHQSLAALAWFAALGCEAAAVCGHSLGEITALSWAGACGAEAAVELAVVRGQLMRRHGAGGTAMASVAATAPRVEQLLAGTDAVIACFNAPEQIVVAGPEADVATLLDRAATAGITANRLPVSHAFHSPAMDPVAEPFRRTLATASLARESHLRAVYSTITGKRLTGTAAELPGLLVDQLTSPVRFSDAVAELAARCDVLVETGPGTILAGLAEANGVGVPAVSMDAGGDPRRHAFVTALLAACAGAELQPWFADRPYRQLALDAVPRFLANPCENRRGRPDTDLPIAQPVPAAAVRPEAAIPPPSTSTDDPLRALTEQLAHRLELRASSIAPSSSLLGDLHMTSLQVVEVVGAVAAALGKEPPSAPLSLSDATVADVAEVLDGLPTATEGPAGAAAAGVRGWVRQFEVTWTPFETIPSEPSAARMDVTLPNDASPAHVAQLLTRIAAQQPARLLVVHSGHPAASGIGRSVAAELPECRVTVIETPRGNVSNPAIDYPAIDHPDRYAELRTRPDGSLERAVVRARRTTGPGDLELKLDGVCLVTGGVRGITAYAAAELAQRMACKLVFVGRSPAEDPEIVRALHDLEPARYLTCDITDQASVQAMVATAREHGPIRGIIHGAGVNEPRTLGDVTAESFQRTHAPKVDGLRNLLAALGDAGDDLRLLLGFGSIIGRQGLAGQAEYCIANDWLRADIEAWARTHPHCRTHLLEWSVWSGIGMGLRLGVLDNLRRMGVEPIGPRHGVDALLEVLTDREAPVTVLVASRFPATATLRVDGEDAPLLRFGERVRTRLPGVEVIIEADLTLGSDPYLDDHRIDGTPVLPAVVAMEAMAQAAAHVRRPPSAESPWSFSHLDLRAPVTVGGPDQRTIQLAALTDGDTVDVVLRDDSDGFGTDRTTASVRPAPQLREQRSVHGRGAREPVRAGEPHEFYGTTFFHSGRFRRLIRYDLLSAFRVRAWIRAEHAGAWFSAFHSNQLLLGDPGAHDATLHVLLACVPHRKALPVGADRVTVWRKPSGVLRVEADELSHTADEYVFNVDLTEPDGAVVARWEGLRLRAITPPQRPETLPVSLVGPWLSRRLIECEFADRIGLMTAPRTRQSHATAGLVQLLTGGSAGHDPAGALRADGHHAGASYAGGTLLLAVANQPVGIDWEAVRPDPAPAGPDSGDFADHAVAELLADKLGEAPTLTRLRVWSAREALCKLGYDQSEPLRVDRITEDGLAILTSGNDQVATARLRTNGPGATPVKVVALACRRGGARA